MKLNSEIRCSVSCTSDYASMASSLCSQMGSAMSYSPSVVSLGGDNYFIPYPTVNAKTNRFGCGFVTKTSDDAGVILHIYPCCKYDSAANTLVYNNKNFYWNYNGNTESGNMDGRRTGGVLVLIFSPIEKDIFSVFGTITDTDRANHLTPAHQLLIGPYGTTRDYMVYGLSSNDNQYVICCEGSGIVNRSVITYKLTTQTQQTYVALQRVICGVAGMPNIYVCSPNENDVITAYFNLSNFNAYQHMSKTGFTIGDSDFRGMLNPGNETLFFILTNHSEEADILDGIGDIEDEGEEFSDDDFDD